MSQIEKYKKINGLALADTFEIPVLELSNDTELEERGFTGNSLAKYIIKHTALSCYVSINDIKGQSRRRRVAEARFIAIYFIDKYATLNINQICSLLERNPTAMNYSTKRFKELYVSDIEFRLKALRVESLISIKTGISYDL